MRGTERAQIEIVRSHHALEGSSQIDRIPQLRSRHARSGGAVTVCRIDRKGFMAEPPLPKRGGLQPPSRRARNRWLGRARSATIGTNQQQGPANLSDRGAPHGQRNCPDL